MEKRAVKFIFTSPSKWKVFSELIKLRFGTKYSHVAIQCYTGPRINTHDIYEAAQGTVHCQDIESFLEGVVIYDARSVSLEAEQYYRMIRWLKRQQQKKYSILGALAVGLPFLRKLGIGKDKDDSFICSELALRALEVGLGIDIARKDDYVDPEAFMALIDALQSNNGQQIETVLT